MGGNASSLIADLTLSMIEYRHLSTNNAHNSPTFRYVDDLIRLKDPLPPNIYPISLTLTEEGPDDNKYVHYLDLSISTTNDHLKLYNKTDYFTFPVIHSMHISCAISINTTKGIIISQLIRYTRNNNQLQDFLLCTSNIIKSYLSNGHPISMIKNIIFSFCNSRLYLLYRYNLYSTNKSISLLLKTIK